MIKIGSVHKHIMKDYGNGILASSDALAAIGQQYLADLKAQERRRQQFRDLYFNDREHWDSLQASYGTWNVSDRD